MDDEAVSKQLDHMIKFIYREADEKAADIMDKAQQEYNMEKNRLINDEREAIRKEFEVKEKQLESKRKM